MSDFVPTLRLFANNIMKCSTCGKPSYIYEDTFTKAQGCRKCLGFRPIKNDNGTFKKKKRNKATKYFDLFSVAKALLRDRLS